MNDLGGGPAAGVNDLGGGPEGVNDRVGWSWKVLARIGGPGAGENRPLLSSGIRGKYDPLTPAGPEWADIGV